MAVRERVAVLSVSGITPLLLHGFYDKYGCCLEGTLRHEISAVILNIGCWNALSLPIKFIPSAVEAVCARTRDLCVIYPSRGWVQEDKSKGRDWLFTALNIMGRNKMNQWLNRLILQDYSGWSKSLKTWLFWWVYWRSQSWVMSSEAGCIQLFIFTIFYYITAKRRDHS